MGSGIGRAGEPYQAATPVEKAAGTVRRSASRTAGPDEGLTETRQIASSGRGARGRASRTSRQSAREGSVPSVTAPDSANWSFNRPMR